jgi:superfamily I DNA/RNA helicase
MTSTVVTERTREMRRNRGIRLHPRFLDGLAKVPQSVWARTQKTMEQVRRDPAIVRQLKGCKKVHHAKLSLFELRVDRDWRVIFNIQPSGEPYLILLGTHDSIFNDARLLGADDLEAGEDDTDVVAAEDVASSQSIRERKPRWGVERHVEREAAPGPFASIPEALFDYWQLPQEFRPIVRSLSNAEQLLDIEGLPIDSFDCIVAFATEGTIKRTESGEETTAADVKIELASREAPKESSALGLMRDHLLDLDLTEEQIASVLGAGTPEDLEQLTLPGRAFQRITEMMTIPVITGMATEVTVDHYAEDSDDLDDYYRQSIKKLLLNLRPAQRALVDLPDGEVQLVKGVAGSGKTTVALYRARALIRRNPNARVLFLTYTKALTGAARELADDLLGPARAERLEVAHIHKWMAGFLRERGGRPLVVGDTEQSEMVLGAINEVSERVRSRLLTRSPNWFRDEISFSIKGRGLKSVEEYLALERIGRQTALAEAARRVVWDVYESYQRLLSPRADWDDFPLRCLEAIESGQAPAPYDHVLIDEAQDLSPSTLRLALQLASPTAPSVLILADAAQSIYRRGFRWKDIGVTMRGRQVNELRFNYRNTAEILAAANVLFADRPDLREDGEASSSIDTTPRHGPPPAIHLATDSRGEVDAIGKEIVRLRREKGLAFGSIAVLAYRQYRLIDMQKTLERSYRIPTVMYNDKSFSLGADRVKLVTLHSAKGLEFPIVFIADLNEGVIPFVPKDADEDAKADAQDQGRKLLFVGMTRAMQELHLVGQRGRMSPLLKEVEGALRA